MTDLIEVRVSNLVGAALDWAVAIAELGKVLIYPDGGLCPPEDTVSMNDGDWTLWVNSGGFHPKGPWSPSTDWSQGGLLIDKYQGSVRHDKHLNDGPCRYTGGTGMDSPWSYGPTPLIAFCRSLVLAKLGDTVQVPKELVHAN